MHMFRKCVRICPAGFLYYLSKTMAKKGSLQDEKWKLVMILKLMRLDIHKTTGPSAGSGRPGKFVK